MTSEGIFVIEAVQPVKITGWRKWKARGKEGRVTVMRHKSLEATRLKKVAEEARTYLGRPYDLGFAWDDEKLYCSELVYKAFQRAADVEVGRKQKLRELELKGLLPALTGRYGDAIPLDLELVTPASIAADEDLEIVFSDVISAM